MYRLFSLARKSLIQDTMAVYTHITHDELSDFLAGYDLGILDRFEGIAAGVSNTNYHVFTDKGRYILTLFEEHRTPRTALPYLFGYAGHLASAGISCPQAYMDKNERIVGTLKGKAAAVLKFLPGHHIPRGQTKTKYCAQIGHFLGTMHNAAESFAMYRENDWGQPTWKALAESLQAQMDRFSPDLNAAVLQEVTYLEAHWPKDKPLYAIHADLFPDNVFFNARETVTAMIDMYFAANDLTAFDLAIVANAWCFSDQLFWRRPAFRRMIQNYETVRPLEKWEIKAFQTLCRGSCLRVILSRIDEWARHDPENTTMTPHDPNEYIHKLTFHQNNDVMAWRTA